MTTRGPTYIHGEVKGKFTTKSVQNSVNRFRDFDYYNYGIFEKALRETFKQLTHIPNNQKYYILENPELDFLPEDALPRPLLPYISRSVSRELYDLRMSLYNQAVLKAAQNNFTVLDPRSALCDELSCRYFDKKFLYADDDHFSIYGSHFIAGHFQRNIFGDLPPVK